MSQAALARASGRDPRRVCEVENGQRLPTPDEVADFERVLGKLPAPPPAESQAAEGDAEWYQEFRDRKRWRLRPERSLQSRIKAARSVNPAKLRSVETKIQEHRACFEDLPLGSSLEMLASADIIRAYGGITLSVRPQLWGYDLLPIRDFETGRVVGHRSFLAFGIRSGPYYLLFIPQLPVGWPDPIRVDFTVGISRDGKLQWRGVEIDGPGHDPSRDAERDAALPYPVLHFDEAAVLAPDFPQRLVERLLDSL